MGSYHYDNIVRLKKTQCSSHVLQVAFRPGKLARVCACGWACYSFHMEEQDVCLKGLKGNAPPKSWCRAFKMQLRVLFCLFYLYLGIKLPLHVRITLGENDWLMDNPCTFMSGGKQLRWANELTHRFRKTSLDLDGSSKSNWRAEWILQSSRNPKSHTLYLFINLLWF